MWYTNAPERWKLEQSIASEILTGVSAGVGGDGTVYLLGDLELCSEHGHVYDTVGLRIVYPPKFPARNQPPNVYLESHRDRWKKGGNSHIESDWRLCLFVPGDSGIDFAKSDSLRKLLSVVHTFLLKERIYQRRLFQAQLTGGEAQWPGPDRSHGLEGIREAVRELGRIGRNAPCPCGSGLKYKKCHMGKL